jgi:hypothetical protein
VAGGENVAAGDQSSGAEIAAARTVGDGHHRHMGRVFVDFSVVDRPALGHQPPFTPIEVTASGCDDGQKGNEDDWSHSKLLGLKIYYRGCNILVNAVVPAFMSEEFDPGDEEGTDPVVRWTRQLSTTRPRTFLFS